MLLINDSFQSPLYISNTDDSYSLGSFSKDLWEFYKGGLMDAHI